MTIADFKARVAAIVNRDATLFAVGGVDNLLQAMNDARRAAQRDHNFQLLKREAFILASTLGTNWQTGCTATPGGSAVQMKRIDGVWQYTTGTVGASTVYLRTAYIDSGVLGDFRRTLPVYDTAQLIITNQPAWWSRRTFWYTQGNKLYVTNQTSQTSYLVEGIEWLPDLIGSEDPDIFLTYFTDWFTYATIAALNYYLKDNEKFPIDMALMQRLTESMKQMDGDIANAGNWTNLD